MHDMISVPYASEKVTSGSDDSSHQFCIQKACWIRLQLSRYVNKRPVTDDLVILNDARYIVSSKESVCDGRSKCYTFWSQMISSIMSLL